MSSEHAHLPPTQAERRRRHQPCPSIMHPTVTRTRSQQQRVPRVCSGLIQVKLYMFKYTSEVTWCHAVPVMDRLVLSDLRSEAAPEGRVR